MLCIEVDAMIFTYVWAIYEGDARNVIEAVQSAEEELLVFGSIVDDVKWFFHNRSYWFLQFVYREKNIVAYTLARTTLF